MATQTHKGVIDVVNTKPWKDRVTGADIVLYSFKIHGAKQWFRTGTNPVPFGVGDAITFVADGQNVDVKSMAKSAEAPVVAAAPALETPQESQAATFKPLYGEKNAASRDEYWANKEARDLEKDRQFETVSVPRMTRSTAVAAAATIVDAALKTEALSFGNVAKSKRIPMLSAFVKELADELYDYITNGPTASAAAASSETENTDNDE